MTETTIENLLYMKQEQRFSVDYHYDVHYTENLFSLDNDLLCSVLPEKRSKVLVVVDSGLLPVFPTLLDDIQTWMKEYSSRVEFVGDILCLEAGEELKQNWSVVETIADAVIETELCRHSFIMMIGGGALLDAVGFAASVAHRGIQQIRIPTTVLAQDDSAVGVKNAINYRGLKNFLGCFSPPYAVINDYAFIRQLPERDRLSGVSEAIKVSLIKDAVFFNYLATNAQKIAQADHDVMKFLIARSAEIHLNHIGKGGDPFEKGSSRPLDFGHWSAHKLESLTKHEIRHGEAVIIGVALDVIISRELKMLSVEEATQILNTIEACGFTLWHDKLAETNESGELLIVKGLAEFREHLGGELTLAMLTGIGSMENIHQLPEDLLIRSLEEMKLRWGSYVAQN